MTTSDLIWLIDYRHLQHIMFWQSMNFWFLFSSVLQINWNKPKNSTINQVSLFYWKLKKKFKFFKKSPKKLTMIIMINIFYPSPSSSYLRISRERNWVLFFPTFKQQKQKTKKLKIQSFFFYGKKNELNSFRIKFKNFE